MTIRSTRFWWSQSDNKSSQLSKILLGNLVDPNKSVIWTVSNFQALQSLYQSFGNSTKSTNYKWHKRHYHVSQFFFNSLASPRYLSFFSFFSILLNGQLVQQSRQFCQFSLFLLIMIRSSHPVEIRWSVCMSKSHGILCLILQDSCWVMHILFVRIAKFKFLAQFPVNNFAFLFMSSLIVFLC